MGIITMNMSQGKIEPDQPVTPDYDDEILCAGWNPALALSQLVPEDKHRPFPAELANVDMELFLKKMYG